MALVIIQFLIGFACPVIAFLLGVSRGKRFVVVNIAELMTRFRADAMKKQNVGGNADEHLRLEGEIRAYDRFIGEIPTKS